MSDRMELKCDSKIECFISIFICFILSVTYVASLYIWRTQYHRDHPEVIKKRFMSVLIMFCISPIFLYVGINKLILEKNSLLLLLGLRTNGLLQAIFIPLFLTMILFLGPLTMVINKNYNQIISGLKDLDWISNFQDLLWIRNSIVAPLSEEFTFRSCMLPLLLQCFHPIMVIFINPLFFGTAHFHHLQERIKQGSSLKLAIQISCFQFAFTTIFGAYSAFIFLRTGHFISIFIAHAFCNLMGFPNFDELINYKLCKRIMFTCLFFLGTILWCLLLIPLTEPHLYHNDTFWITNSS